MQKKVVLIVDILRLRLHGSPYVGIFATVTEKIGLFPFSLPSDLEKKISDALGIEIVKATLANSSLLGVLAVGNSNGFIVSEIVEDRELDSLHEIGLKVKRLNSIAAIGNLVEVNDSKGVCSKIFSKEAVREMENFLKISISSETIAGSDLIGSSLVLTKNGFLMNPNALKSEFNSIKKFLNLNYGGIGTANYGDNFVGNSLLANGRAAIAGEQTSGYELIRIDEGLRGD